MRGVGLLGRGVLLVFSGVRERRPEGLVEVVVGEGGQVKEEHSGSGEEGEVEVEHRIHATEASLH